MTIYGAMFCAFMLTIFNVSAQNIVPNPSFEEHDECPVSLGDFTPDK